MRLCLKTNKTTEKQNQDNQPSQASHRSPTNEQVRGNTETGVRHDVVHLDPNAWEAKAGEPQVWLQPCLHRKAVLQPQILTLEPQPIGKEREMEGWEWGVYHTTSVQPGGPGRAEKGSRIHAHTGLLTFHESCVCTAGMAEVPHV